MQDTCQERRKEVPKRKEEGADRQEGEQMVAVIKRIPVSPGCLAAETGSGKQWEGGTFKEQSLEEAPHRLVPGLHIYPHQPS